MGYREWEESKLVVGRFPTPGEISKSNFDVIINVSDEYISSCHDAASSVNKKYYWFPMNEATSDIGLNSLFGALQILWICEKENKRVLLHCHAGANRSPTVRDAFFYLRNGRHRPRENKNSPKDELDTWLGITTDSNNNRLLDNIEFGHLPSIRKLESFLKLLHIQFSKEETTKGGALDWSKAKSLIE